MLVLYTPSPDFSTIMAITNRPADPLAKGTLATAKQGFKDLFIWDQRVVVRNDYGEEHCEWQKPEPLKNPISLFAQLKLKDWLYFLVGFLAWTADAFDFHALVGVLTHPQAYPTLTMTLEHSNDQAGCLLQAIKYKHHNRHHLDTASPFRRCCLFRPGWRQVWPQMAHGAQHDYSRSPSSRDHLLCDFPAVPRCTKSIWTLHGRCVR